MIIVEKNDVFKFRDSVEESGLSAASAYLAAEKNDLAYDTFFESFYLVSDREAADKKAANWLDMFD